MFQFVCTRCGKKCKNAVGSATHMKYHTKRKVVDSPSLLRFVKSSGKENPNWSPKYDQNQTQSHSVPEPIQSHCASHSIRKYSPLQHQEAQDILAHRLQISATISRLKVLCLRVWISSHQSFVWSKVFPLDQWKSKKLTEREEFSDDEESDKEDEGHKEDEVGEFEVPLKKIEAQKAPQKRLCIQKKWIREKSAVPRKWKQKQPPGSPPLQSECES